MFARNMGVSVQSSDRMWTLEQLHRLRQLQRLPANRNCPRTGGSVFVVCHGVLI